jgi:hypothetical protein
LLAKDDKGKESIYQTIENTIEHQDGVAQASPFMVRALFFYWMKTGLIVREF